MATTPTEPSKHLLEAQQVLIDYTNWKGVRGERVIRPIAVFFGATEYHPQPQWLLRAWDIDKDAERDFALQDVHRWQSLLGG